MTLAQRRAADALDRVRNLSADEALRTSYRAYVERLGPSILINGLGQALASELAAAGPAPENPDQAAHRSLHDNLAAWLCRPDGIYPECTDVLAAIVHGDEPRYLHAQAEALAWLEWHKKFCRAALPRK